MGQEVAALRDFNPAYVSSGSQPAVTASQHWRPVMFDQQTYSPPKILEPIDGQLGIADGVLVVLMTEVLSQRASIMAIVGELVSAGVKRQLLQDHRAALG
jgi:hypothetical protein